MSRYSDIVVFGEVLFDCFPSGEKLLGGAPFNVAYHLQALGDQPCFISRIGLDEFGEQIVESVRQWGMNSSYLQRDHLHPTGLVEVIFENNEPEYVIVTDSAYDFIREDELPSLNTRLILYHGTLALRNDISRSSCEKLRKRDGVKIFVDVNLRSPWWRKDEVLAWLDSSHYAKMNEDELDLLSDDPGGLEKKMEQLQRSCDLEHLIITRGERGAIVRTAAGEIYNQQAEPVEEIKDTVGAGDAFSAVYLHGLYHNWSLAETLLQAQRFAGKVVGLRGATPSSREFYSYLRKEA